MATATHSPFLQVNSAGTVDALALEVWSGMVLEAYNKRTVTEGRHIQRTIDHGKQAQFPVLGRMGTVFHTAGTEVSFQEVYSNAITIAIQDLLLAPIFIDILDEAKSHFDVRRPYAVQQGQALAEAADLRVLMSFVEASRTGTGTITGSYGTPAGQQVTAATVGTDAAVLKGAIYDAAEILDENNIPAMERYLFLAPGQFYLLLQDGEFIDRDFVEAGNGDRAKAVMRNAADFEVIKTNNLPSGDQTANTDLPTALRNNYSTTVAITGHKSAAGSVTLVGLQFEQEYDMNRQGHMLIAKYAKGFGYLRPEAAVELATA